MTVSPALPPRGTEPRRTARVAVIIPARNEAPAIAQVVAGFMAALPDAFVVVADNASTDGTGQIAATAGALVIPEPRPGKGVAVQRLFADVDADCYILVDGDGTYSPAVAPEMVRLVLDEHIDMVVAARDAETSTSYRPGHTLGNRALTRLMRRLFRLPLTDALSGYRALSRRYVQSFASTSAGFEIETDLNVHAAELHLPIAEVRAPYRERAKGTSSKLNTVTDGWRILRRNLRLFCDVRPSTAFTLLTLPWMFAAAYCTYFANLVAGVISGVATTGFAVAGVVVSRLSRSRVAAARLAYLNAGTSPRR